MLTATHKGGQIPARTDRDLSSRNRESTTDKKANPGAGPPKNPDPQRPIMFLMFGLFCILPCVFVGPCVLLRFVADCTSPVPPSRWIAVFQHSFGPFVFFVCFCYEFDFEQKLTEETKESRYSVQIAGSLLFIARDSQAAATIINVRLYPEDKNSPIEIVLYFDQSRCALGDRWTHPPAKSTQPSILASACWNDSVSSSFDDRDLAGLENRTSASRGPVRFSRRNTFVRNLERDYASRASLGSRWGDAHLQRCSLGPFFGRWRCNCPLRAMGNLDRNLVRKQKG